MLGRSKGLRGLAFGLVLLGFCVFGWGLRYKLSLYDPPHSVDRRMPEAKLLTGKECGEFAAAHVRPAAAATTLPLALGGPALTLVLFAAPAQVTGFSVFGTLPALARPAPPSVSRLSFSARPPPVHY